MPDFRIADQGSIVMVTPLTQPAKDWVEENVQLEGWQWLGGGFAVEPRYVMSLASGIADAGLEMVEG